MNTNEKEISGILIIDKHEGITSHGIIGKIRRMYNIKRVGHTGTLDPLATGVLPVLVGRAAKASDYIMSEDKTYVAEMKLGLTTDTEDITGEILSESEDIPDSDTVMNTVSEFTGEIEQIPPMYSALKVNGKKLVNLAREGIEIERNARKITVYSIECERESDILYRMTVKCSKGTYIRTLCSDIGKKLGCGAVMASLRRIQTGCFDISQSVTIDELENMPHDERIKLLGQNPVENLFSSFPKVKFPEFFEHLSRNGAEVYLSKIGLNLDVGESVSLYGKDGFYGIGEVCEYPDGFAVKTTKLFVL